MNVLQKLDSFALQPGHRGRQIGNAERPVVDNVPACADEAATRPRPDRNRDVIEEYGAGGITDKTRKLGKRRPRGGAYWCMPRAGRLSAAPGIRRAVDSRR